MAAWEPAPDEPERPPLPEASDEPQQSAAPEQLGFDVQDGPEPLRYVGEIFRTYILAERGDEICIIDKHAAHERQLFEKLAPTTAMSPASSSWSRWWWSSPPRKRPLC